MNTIQVEDLGDNRKKVTVEVPQEKLQEKLNAQYRDLKKTVQIKGFRKGKVPLNILKAYFGQKVEEDAKRELIEETFEPGLAEKDITPVQVIKIEPDDLDEEKPFTYRAEIEVPPDIEVKDYKGLSLKKYIRQADEGEVDSRLEKLREAHARMTPCPENSGAKEGHHLVVDIKAECEGEAIPSLTVTDYSMELGRNFYLPDFDSNLIGMRVDDSHRITVDMPSDFVQKNLAGKPVQFEITIKEAKERVLPALDDDFAKDLGEYQTLDELKSKIRESIQEGLDRQVDRELEDQIVAALIERNEFDVPAAMVDNQVDHLLNQSMQALVRYGIDPKSIPPPTPEHREKLQPEAERNVRAALLVKAVADTENLQVTDEEVEAGIEKRAESMGVSVDHLKDELREHNLMGDLRASLLQEKAFSFLKEQAEISEEEPPPEENQEPDTEKE